MLRPIVSSTLGSMNAVDVLVDKSGHLGPLSYSVPPELSVSVGDAVEVPFGRQIKYGVVVGPATNMSIQLKDIHASYGPRADSREVQVAAILAERHFTESRHMHARLAPNSAKGAPPLAAGPVQIRSIPQVTFSTAPESRAFVARAAALSPEHLALNLVALAVQQDPTGQILVLCPSVPLVESVLEGFVSGAARLDAAASRGAWRGFLDGTVQVGVGTRAAALYSAKRLSCIIVLEADHPGHTAVKIPYVSSVEIASERSVAHDASLYLTGLVPKAQYIATTKLTYATASGVAPCTTSLISRFGTSPRRLVPPAAVLRIEQARRNGKRVVVVAPQDTVKRRCQSCRDVWETTSVSCVRCGSTSWKATGWDKARLGEFFKDRVKVCSPAETAKLKDVDLLVLTGTDAALSRASLQLEWEFARYCASLTTCLSPAGELLLLSDDDGSTPVIKAVTSNNPRAVARVVWAAAKTAALPPFGAVVEIELNGRKSSPDVRNLPGRVLGPQRVDADSWRVVCVIQESDRKALRTALQKWRSLYKIRVTVAS